MLTDLVGFDEDTVLFWRIGLITLPSTAYNDAQEALRDKTVTMAIAMQMTRSKGRTRLELNK
jgi:hypothetical protein